MLDLEQFILECEQSPRLNQLAGFFSATAAGRNGMPLRKPVADLRLLPNEALLHRFVELHARRQGHFDQHYHSSIPYRLEEECRMGHALLRYSQLNPGSTLLYSLGTAEGTMARSLSELSGGRIRSLSCSPNAENLACFMAYGKPPHAEFFLGPFHRLSKDHLGSEEALADFTEGFDVILEDTTFQMYAPNRMEQVAFAAQHLKHDGILLFLEKFRAADPREYQTREAQKDFGFKARHFAAADIARKTAEVLLPMHNGEVTLAEMSNAVYAHFRYCAITWNSGNFYGLAASNSRENLWRYLSMMAEPAIPSEYIYETQLYGALSAHAPPHRHDIALA